MDYQHERHNVHLVVYHLIWCPKRRRKTLVGPIKERLEHLTREVARSHGWTQSFFVSTAGNVSHEIIQRYIERQSRV